MPRGVIVLAIALLLSLTENVYSTTPWQTWIARNDVQQVVEGEHRLFVLADGALHTIDKDKSNVQLFDRTNGLSDVGIAHIAWATELKKLLIVYHSGMIDLLGSSGIEHIPALRQADHIPNKSIKEILIIGSKAWLAGAYGIIQLNLRNSSVEATYLMGQSVESVAIEGESSLWAVSEGSLWNGNLSDNLQDPSRWTLAQGLGAGWTQIVGTNTGLYGLRLGEVQNIQYSTSVSASDLGHIQRLFSAGGVLIAQASDKIFRVVPHGSELIATVSEGSLAGSFDRGILWLAQGKRGILQLSREGDVWTQKPIDIAIDAPIDNSMYTMRYNQGRLYIVSGGRNTDRFHRVGSVQIFDGNKWEVLSSEDITSQSGIDFLDPIDIIPHRDNNPLHYYVATWGEGLYEFDNGRLVARYDTGNSALVSAIPGVQNYTRVGSLAYDIKGNLWMAQGLTKDSKGGSIVRLSPSGSWHTYDYAPIRASNSFHTQVTFANGTKWLLDNHLSDHGEGVFVYNDKGTDNLTDDAYAHYSSLREANGKTINFSKLTAMAIDKRGVLWLGSNIGFFFVQRPNSPPLADKLPTAVRPVTTNSEGILYYVLDNVAITSIAVDRLNRKWIATLANGLYLLSEDGKEVLRHYTTENSPLLANHILSLAIDELGGRLFIGTGMGLNILDTATSDIAHSEPTDFVVYPNPLRPEYPDIITMEGLPAGSVVHISNVAGRVVHRGVAVDHQYQWQPYGADGRRLPSGVYTIVLSSHTGNRLSVRKVSIVSND